MKSIGIVPEAPQDMSIGGSWVNNTFSVDQHLWKYTKELCETIYQINLLSLATKGLASSWIPKVLKSLENSSFFLLAKI